MNRDDFIMINDDLIYFDNGATTLKPKCVIDSINDYYTKYCANAHRGDYHISQIVDNLYEGVREKVKDFIHAKEKSEIIFTSGATDGLNRIVFGYFKDKLKEGINYPSYPNHIHGKNLLIYIRDYLIKKRKILKRIFIQIIYIIIIQIVKL